MPTVSVAVTPEQVLRLYAPEQRVAGLTLAQVLCLYAPEQMILALPDDMLRELPEHFITRLSPETVAIIHKRLGRM